jgi:glycosyltransferase involved in cell wall biosynthesis
MKKILVIEPAGKLYGSEMVLFDILKNIANKQEFRWHVVLPPNSDFSSKLLEIDITHDEFLNIHKGIFNKFISYWKLFFHLCFNRYDLIYINQAGILRSVAIMAYIFKLPIVCQVSILEDCDWLNTMNPFYYRNVQSFITNSNYIFDRLNVPEQLKSVLYYGYEWKGLKVNKRDSTRPFNCVLLGRVSESKGHFVLINAANILIKERGYTQLKFYFVGSAPSKSIEDDVIAEITKFGMLDNFILRGFQRDIHRELSDKNLMIVPSFEEPFGRIFCEGAEAQLPMIVSDGGGLGELSSVFDVAVRFKSRDHIDLADKIELFMNNNSLEREKFIDHSQKMLLRLDMSEYLFNIVTIINESINWKKKPIKWLGSRS